MPREIKRYLCEFKCGSRPKDLGGMRIHENGCWKNPKNKSCMTCKHEGKTKKNYTNIDFRRYCEIKEISGVTFTENEVKNEKMHFGYRTKGILMPKTNCKHWELK